MKRPTLTIALLVVMTSRTAVATPPSPVSTFVARAFGDDELRGALVNTDTESCEALAATVDSGRALNRDAAAAAFACGGLAQLGTPGLVGWKERLRQVEQDGASYVVVYRGRRISLGEARDHATSLELVAEMDGLSAARPGLITGVAVGGALAIAGAALLVVWDQKASELALRKETSATNDELGPYVDEQERLRIAGISTASIGTALALGAGIAWLILVADDSDDESQDKALALTPAVSMVPEGAMASLSFEF